MQFYFYHLISIYACFYKKYDSRILFFFLNFAQTFFNKLIRKLSYFFFCMFGYYLFLYLFTLSPHFS